MAFNKNSNILYIAEKPSLAEAIALAYNNKPVRKNGFFDCGNNVLVTWCYGHMLKLKNPADHDKTLKKWALKNLPYKVLQNYTYKVDPEKKNQLKIIFDLVEKFDTIINAGDPDDEGQRIVDSVLEFGKFKNKNIFRIWVNDNNTDVILKQIPKIKSNDEYKGLSQRSLARAVADQIYGFNLTAAYSVKNGFLLNFGRVSTSILALIYKRVEANKNHVSSNYYNLFANFSFNNEKFQAKLISPDSSVLDEEGRIVDINYLEDILNKCNKGVATVDFYESKEIEQQPPLTYNLLKLQGDCSDIYGFKSQKTMDITQELRDKKLITYNRTDSQYLNDEHHLESSDVLSVLIENLGLNEDVKSQINPNQKSQVFNAKKVTAHHAIIPTKMKISDLSEPLSQDQENVYKLIADRYLMQFLPYRRVAQVSTKINVSDFLFSANSSKEVLAGWRSFDRNFKEDTDKETVNIPELTVGQGGACNDLQIKTSKTKPPRLYTEKTLLEDISRVAQYIKDPELKQVLIDRDKGNEGEHGGIGTSSTRGAIIDTLFNNGFIENNKRFIVTTEKGERYYHILPEELKTPDRTAKWEIELQKIEDGEIVVNQFIGDLQEQVSKWVDFVINDSKYHSGEPDLCKECSNILVLRKGKSGNFYGCSNYPDCGVTYPLNEAGKPDYDFKPVVPEESEYSCKKCDKPLIKRNFKGSEFYGCSGYPDCRTSYQVKSDGTPDYAVYECQECKSPLIKRSFKGSDFFGCSSYPKCKKTYQLKSDGTPDFK